MVTEENWEHDVPLAAIHVDMCVLCGALVPRGSAVMGPYAGRDIREVHEENCLGQPGRGVRMLITPSNGR